MKYWHDDEVPLNRDLFPVNELGGFRDLDHIAVLADGTVDLHTAKYLTVEQLAEVLRVATLAREGKL